jgi:hypothetical protein
MSSGFRLLASPLADDIYRLFLDGTAYIFERPVDSFTD